MIGTFKAARDRVAGWSKVAAVIWAHFFTLLDIYAFLGNQGTETTAHSVRGLPVHRNSVSSRLVGGFELS